MSDGHNGRNEGKPYIRRSSVGSKLRLYVVLLLPVKRIPNQLWNKDKGSNGGSGRGCVGSIIAILLEIPRVEMGLQGRWQKTNVKEYPY